jgi:hypothetical protein
LYGHSDTHRGVDDVRAGCRADRLAELQEQLPRYRDEREAGEADRLGLDVVCLGTPPRRQLSCDVSPLLENHEAAGVCPYRGRRPAAIDASISAGTLAASRMRRDTE